MADIVRRCHDRQGHVVVHRYWRGVCVHRLSVRSLAPGLCHRAFICQCQPRARFIAGGLVRRYYDKHDNKGAVDKGVLLSSGLIAGEALVGVGLAGCALAGLDLSTGLQPGIGKPD